MAWRPDAPDARRERDPAPGLSRRLVVAGLAGGPVLLHVSAGRAEIPQRIRAELDALFGPRVATMRPGRVTLDLPTIAENGSTVPMVVEAESPMIAADHVRAIYVFNERNPQPHVGRFHFTRHSGRARVATRIRLAAAQTVLAVAETGDGALWHAQADVVIGFAACMDPG